MLESADKCRRRYFITQISTVRNSRTHRTTHRHPNRITCHVLNATHITAAMMAWLCTFTWLIFASSFFVSHFISNIWHTDKMPASSVHVVFMLFIPKQWVMQRKTDISTLALSFAGNLRNYSRPLMKITISLFWPFRFENGVLANLPC